MAHLTFRLATLEDKDHVLAINDNVYDGKDYLPALYDHLLSCPNARPYVGVYKGEIVSFVVAFVVDDGHTVVTRAARSSPKYAGRGFYSALFPHVMQLSEARENAFTTMGSTVSVDRQNKLMLSKEMLRFLFKPHTVNISDILKKNMSTIRPTTPSDLVLYMNSWEHRKYLFPDEVIIVNWVPYRLLSSNIPLIGVPGRTNMLADVDAGNKKGLLSFVTVYESRDPPFTANMDVYGSDPKSIVIHVAAQMDFIKSRTDALLHLLVFVDNRLSVAEVEYAFDMFGVKKSIWKTASIENSKQFLFRSQINASRL